MRTSYEIKTKLKDAGCATWVRYPGHPPANQAVPPFVVAIQCPVDTWLHCSNGKHTVKFNNNSKIGGRPTKKINAPWDQHPQKNKGRLTYYRVDNPLQIVPKLLFYKA